MVKINFPSKDELFEEIKAKAPLFLEYYELLNISSGCRKCIEYLKKYEFIDYNYLTCLYIVDKYIPKGMIDWSKCYDINIHTEFERVGLCVSCLMKKFKYTNTI